MPHKKTSKLNKKTKRRHRGGYYGAGGPILDGGQGPAGMEWGSKQEVPTVEVNGVPIPVNLKTGGHKKRESKKSSKRKMRGGHKKRESKKSSKRKMQGGTKFGGTFASYEGSGARGLANVSQGTHTPGAPQLGRFNNFGAGPSDFNSFKGLRPDKF
jgi:hypothetical protein